MLYNMYNPGLGVYKDIQINKTLFDNLIKAKGISIKELSCILDIYTGTIYGERNGDLVITLNHLDKYVEFFDITAEELLSLPDTYKEVIIDKGHTPKETFDYLLKVKGIDITALANATCTRPIKIQNWFFFGTKLTVQEIAAIANYFKVGIINFLPHYYKQSEVKTDQEQYYINKYNIRMLMKSNNITIERIKPNKTPLDKKLVKAYSLGETFTKDELIQLTYLFKCNIEDLTEPTKEESCEQYIIQENPAAPRNYITVACIMLERNITLGNLSSMTGIDKSILSKWKNGKKLLSLSPLKQVAECLDINLDLLTVDKQYRTLTTETVKTYSDKTHETKLSIDWNVKFKELLNTKGISVKKIAKDLGVSLDTVYKWISGNNCPYTCNLEKITEYLGVSQDYFYNNTDKEDN